GTLLSRLRDVLLHHGRALRPRGYGHDLWSRDNAFVSAHHSVLLVYSGFARLRRIGDRYAGGRGLLPLDSRCVWRLLGISRGLVELLGVFPARRHIRSPVRRLFLLLSPADDLVAALPFVVSVNRSADLD